MPDAPREEFRAPPRTAQGGFAPRASVVAAERDTMGPSADEWADLNAARRVVLWTSVAALVVGTGIEWAGWQVLFRHTPDFYAATRTLFGIPVVDWAIGALRNAAGAIGVGIGTAAFSMLWPRAWRHPWRSVSSGFAIGVTATLVLLGVLTGWAP